MHSVLLETCDGRLIDGGNNADTSLCDSLLVLLWQLQSCMLDPPNLTWFPRHCVCHTLSASLPSRRRLSNSFSSAVNSAAVDAIRARPLKVFRKIVIAIHSE